LANGERQDGTEEGNEEITNNQPFRKRTKAGVRGANDAGGEGMRGGWEWNGIYLWHRMGLDGDVLSRLGTMTSLLTGEDFFAESSCFTIHKYNYNNVKHFLTY
jgi:hypothetical protein